MNSEDLIRLEHRIVGCRACPRLVRFRERTAAEGGKRDGTKHWGSPIAGFGDPEAELMVVGLAPAARGANRTGRVFTGDRSADFLVSALHRASFANQPTSTSRNDGLVYTDAFVTAAVRCVPPDNKPSPAETRNCLPYLVQEMKLLPKLKAILALGKFAWDASFSAAVQAYGTTSRKSQFAHGRTLDLGQGLPLLWGTYHPSPRNTQTGLLTSAMFDRELSKIRKFLRETST